MTNTPDNSNVVVAANDALKELGAAIRQLENVQKRQDEQIQAIKDENKVLIEGLEAKIVAFKTILANLWQEHGSELRDTRSKTATLRNGTLSERSNPESLWMGDPALVLKYLRKMGVVRKFTRQPPREVVKALLRRDVAFVDGAPDHLLHFQRSSTLHVSPTQSLVESQRGTAALQIPLTGRQD